MENFAPIATRIAERKTDKLLRAAATLCLRGTRGSKIRNRPRNQVVVAITTMPDDEPDVIDRGPSYHRILIEFSAAVNDTAIDFSIVWTRFRQSRFSNPFLLFSLAHFILLRSSINLEIYLNIFMAHILSLHILI